MADHFEEIVNLRISALDARIEGEAQAVEQHFAEQREFITHSLGRLDASLRGALASGLAEVRAEMRQGFSRLERKLDANVDRLDGNIVRLDQKLDANIGRLDASIARLDQKLDANISRIDASVARLDADIKRLDASIIRLDQKVDANIARLDASIVRLEQKVDAHHEVTQEALREVLRRLPAPSADQN